MFHKHAFPFLTVTVLWKHFIYSDSFYKVCYFIDKEEKAIILLTVHLRSDSQVSIKRPANTILFFLEEIRFESRHYF